MTPISETSAGAQSVTVITSAGRSLPDIVELWQARHLAALFAWRNVKLRYKQSAFGLLWIMLQPLAATGVFTLFFGAVAKIPTGDVPYPLFVLAGLVPWQFFSRTLSEGTVSLVGMTSVLSKVYLPRLLMPISALLTAAVDFAIVLVPVIAVLAIGGYLPLRVLIGLPVAFLLVAVTALGASLWTSACDVLFRDSRVVVGFVLQFGLFFTPVIYPANLVPGAWQGLYLLNPLVPIIELFRWALIVDAPLPPGWSLAAAAATSAVVLAGGLVIFTRTERVMTDRI